MFWRISKPFFTVKHVDCKLSVSDKQSVERASYRDQYKHGNPGFFSTLRQLS
jgi:hypothetical protein